MKLYHAQYAQQTMGGGFLIKEDDYYLPDEASVRRQLRGEGLWPIHIREHKPPLFEWMDVRSREWQLQLLRAIRFQSATASAGTALLSIVENEQDPRRRLAFLPTRTVLKSGGAFSEALNQLRLMDAATMAIITAGERAGDLKGVIQHAIEHVEQKGSQVKALVATLSWLSFDIISTISTIWAMQFGIIPYLAQQGTKASDVDAVLKFQHGISVAQWVNGSMLVFTSALILAVGVLVLSYWMNRHKPHHLTSRILLKMPIFSTYFKNVSMQDSTRLMARLLRGKVPVDEALSILIENTVEPASLIYWTDCRNRLMAGVDLASSLARWPLNKAERDQILSIQSADQLAEVYTAISNERMMMAKAGQRKLVKSGIFLLMFIAGVTVLTFIYLLMLQNQTFLNNINEMNGGG